MYIDIHTHKKSDNHFSLQNLFPEEVKNAAAGKYFSLGLHPWELAAGDIAPRMLEVKKNISRENILAVGETGLDKYRPAFALQKTIFLTHLKLAENQKKPLIIHCVKAFSELLEIFKENPPEIPCIIHRYSGNMTIAGQLQNFNCHFSFGQDLFNSRNKAVRIYKSLPLEKTFLETDDSAFSIKEIYQKAADLRAISPKDLQTQIRANFCRCFPENILFKK